MNTKLIIYGLLIGGFLLGLSILWMFLSKEKCLVCDNDVCICDDTVDICGNDI